MDKLKTLGKAVNAVGRLSPKLAGNIALQLFMRPRRIPIHPSSAEFLASADRLELSFGKGIVGYRAEAIGPERQRVLLIHGWESHAGRWVPLMRRLTAKGCTCYAVDGPAAGQSGGRTTPFNYYIEALLAFEQEFGPFDAYVGHSLGGGVVAQLLRLVPNARLPKRAVVMAAFDESEHVFDRYERMMAYTPAVRAAFDAHIGTLVEKVRAGATIRSYSNTAALNQVDGVAGLVVHSRDDKVSPYCEGLALHEAWTDSTLVSFSDKGHGLTAPEVLTEVEAFITAA